VAQLNLIPGKGFVLDNDQGQLNLIPRVGFVPESVVGGVSVEIPTTDLVLSTTAPLVSVSSNISFEVPVVNLTLTTVAPSVGTGYRCTNSGPLPINNSTPDWWCYCY